MILLLQRTSLTPIELIDFRHVSSEYLIQKGYVAADKVIIMGESNGGELQLS